MNKIIIVGLILSLVSCSNKSGPSVPARPTIPVPDFKIVISLSEAASILLSDANETIICIIFFDGDGTPISNSKTAPFRDVFLGKYQFEMDEQGDVTISDAIISQEAFERLSDKNYHFFVNVVSGRRIFKNNVLRGGYADGRASDLDASEPILIKCDLN